MSRLMRYLNDENQVLKDFINKWSRDPVSGVDVRDVALPVENCHKQAFGLNESPLEELIEKEVKEKFIPAFRELACIPLLGEIEEPWMLSFSRKRIQYVVENVPTWDDYFTTKSILYFYRRMTSDEYQTPAHMRIVYALAAASELATSATVIVDDKVDGATTRSGATAWHLRSSVPIETDCLLLNELAKLIMRSCVPDNHPAKAGLVQLMDDFQQRNAYYWCFSSFLQTIETKQEGQPQCPFQVRLVTLDTLLSQNYLRAFQYVWYLFEIPRLAACYTGIQRDDIHILRDQIFRATDLTCILDDLQDNPDSKTPVDKATKDELSDIMSGEVYSRFLLEALEIARQDDSSLSEQQREEIFDVLQRHYGTHDESDARCVLTMYHKYGMYERVKLRMRRNMEKYAEAAKELTRLNMPRDMLWYLISFIMVGGGGNQGPISEMQRLGRDGKLSPVEKEKLLMRLIDGYF